MSTVSAETSTSTPPVGMAGFSVPSGLRRDRPFDADHVLLLDLVRRTVGGRGYLGGEDHLHDAAYVPQVEEDETPVVAPPVNPSRQLHAHARIAAERVPQYRFLKVDLLEKPFIIAEGRASVKGPPKGRRVRPGYFRVPPSLLLRRLGSRPIICRPGRVRVLTYATAGHRGGRTCEIIPSWLSPRRTPGSRLGVPACGSIALLGRHLPGRTSLRSNRLGG